MNVLDGSGNPSVTAELGLLGRMLRLWRLASTNKRSVARCLNAHEQHLCGGVWLLTALSYARRWPGAGPAPSTSGRWTVLAPQGSAAKRLLLKALVALAPPALMLARPGTKEFRARSALLTKSGGLILFDPISRTVKHLPRVPYAPDYPIRRELLARYLPIPRADVRDRGCSVTEDWVPGHPLSEEDGSLRSQVIRDLLQRYCQLARDHAGADSVEALTWAFSQLDAAPNVPVRIKEQLEESRDNLVNSAARWPLVPSHGDLTLLNILVGEGGSWTLIDFEDADNLPYFFDVLSLLLRDPGLTGLAIEGAFDFEFAQLAAAAGSREENPDLRLLMWACALLAAARHAQRHGGDLAVTLHSLWPHPPRPLNAWTRPLG